MVDLKEIEKKELEMLKRKSPYALPDNPSQAGWTSAQIKEKFYSGLIYLYSIFKDTRNSVEERVSAMQELIAEVNKQYDAIMNGEGGFAAEKDIEGNPIITTYAKISELKNGNTPVSNYLDKNGKSKAIHLLENLLDSLSSELILLKNKIPSSTSQLKNDSNFVTLLELESLVSSAVKHVYSGDTPPTGSTFDTWLDTSENQEEQMLEEPIMLMSMRPTAKVTQLENEEQLIYNTEDCGELLIENDTIEELIDNPEDCGELLYE